MIVNVTRGVMHEAWHSHHTWKFECTAYHVARELPLSSFLDDRGFGPRHARFWRVVRELEGDGLRVVVLDELEDGDGADLVSWYRWSRGQESLGENQENRPSYILGTPEMYDEDLAVFKEAMSNAGNARRLLSI